jgi:branched-chain amino acid transport system ATP-binding protein
MSQPALESPSNQTILAVEGLTKNFGGVTAVDQVSFKVRQGELIGVIGPNGSGKTTLVNLITGFVKPSTGKVVVKGKDVTGWAPYAIADLGLARTFQMVKPFYQLPAFKNVVVALFSPRVRRLAGGAYGDRDAVAKDLLEEVGFERDSWVINKQASVLPHGYLKRLELARCLALRPDVLVLDELFSGLSLAEVASLVPVIEKLMVQGMTIIMVEHRLKELFRIADRVLVLNFGQKIAEGSPREVMAQPKVRGAYLGSESED